MGAAATVVVKEQEQEQKQEEQDQSEALISPSINNHEQEPASSIHIKHGKGKGILGHHVVSADSHEEEEDANSDPYPYPFPYPDHDPSPETETETETETENDDDNKEVKSGSLHISIPSRDAVILQVPKMQRSRRVVHNLCDYHNYPPITNDPYAELSAPPAQAPIQRKERIRRRGSVMLTEEQLEKLASRSMRSLARY